LFAVDPWMFLLALALVGVQTFILNGRWMLIMHSLDVSIEWLAGMRILMISLCLGRPATERERAILTKLLHKQMESFKAAPKEALALTPPDLPKEIDATRFAAWTSIARSLLNLDEFITRE